MFVSALVCTATVLIVLHVLMNMAGLSLSGTLFYNLHSQTHTKSWYWIGTLHGTRSCGWWLIGIAGGISVFDVGGRLSAAWCRS